MASADRVWDKPIAATAWQQQDSLPLHVLSLPLGGEVYIFLSPRPIAALRAAATATKAVTAPFLCEALATAMADEKPWLLKDVSAKVASMRALSHLGPHLIPLEKVLPMVLSTTVRRLVDPEPRLRSEALQCLSRIVPGGSALAAGAIQQELHAHDDCIGAGKSCAVTALLALGHVAEKGDAETISLLVKYLGKGDVNICMAAGQALGRMAGRGNKSALTLVAQQLACEGAQQEAALIAFRRLARRGDAVAVDLLVSKVDARKPVVCRALLDCLRHIATRGDGQATAAAKQLLGTQNAPLRAAAVAAYGSLANLEDPDAHVTLTSFLKDDAPAVRQAARDSILDTHTAASSRDDVWQLQGNASTAAPESLVTPTAATSPMPKPMGCSVCKPCRPHCAIPEGFKRRIRHRHNQAQPSKCTDDAGALEPVE